MRIGILSDAHGNSRVMARCLRVLEKQEVDRIYFLGDAIGYMPGENEVLDILRLTPVQCQKGNHEAMLLADIPLSEEKDKVYGILAARERISQINLHFIREWPDCREIHVEGRKIFFVHGSLEDHLEGYVYLDTDFSILQEYAYDAIFMGHTHYPFVLSYCGIQVVNVGSCGLPRDQGNVAAFAIYDTSIHCTEIFRLPFDTQKIIQSFGQIPISHEVIDCFNRRSHPPLFGLQVNEDTL